jgi:hypothetical protein
MTKEDYDKKMKEMKEKQYDINIQIEDHTRADENYYITASNVLNLAKNAFELFKSSEVPEKRAFLNYPLQNPIVIGKTLTFELKKPFDLVLNLANAQTKTAVISDNCPVWLRIVDNVRTIISRQNEYIYIPDLRT